MRFALLAGIAAVGAAAFALPVVATTQTGPLIVTVTTSPNPYAIEGTTSVAKSAGILGYGTAANDVALEGYATQAGGVGLEGFSNASSGTAGNGVFGYSNNGSGLYGVANSGSYAGVTGYSKDTGGSGVYGDGAQNGVTGTSPNIGVIGSTTSASTTGDSIAGVEGFDSSSGSPQIGVYGESNAGVGVQAFTEEGSEAVLGTSQGGGSSGYGIYGNDLAPNGAPINDATVFNPVYAGVAGASSQNFGVYGYTASTATSDPELAGVIGQDGSSGGQIGVWGLSQHGVGMFAESEGTKPALILDAESSGPILVAYGDISNSDAMSVDGFGNMILAGKLTQNGTPLSTAWDGAGSRRITYGAQQTMATIEDFGSGSMRDGLGHVALDPEFASMLAPGAAYMVIVTPDGPNAGVYVTAKTATGFDVRETSGRATMGFDYRIVGRPREERSLPRLASFAAPRHSFVRRHISAAALANETHRISARGFIAPPARSRGPLLPPMPVVIAPK